LRQFIVAGIVGFGSQNFLGARWVESLFRISPEDRRRRLALELLALSPHYFYRTPANAQLDHRSFLEAECVRNRTSRQKIVDLILAPYLLPSLVGIDYGCGPGFMARAAAARLKTLYAIDISAGVLACAKAVNSAPNLEFKLVRDGKIPLPAASVDLVYSFAVVQHVTNDVFKGMLAEWHRALRPGGTILCHVAIDEEGWQTEAQKRADRSLAGRIKWRFGLHCFSRSEGDLSSLIQEAGFDDLKIMKIREMGVHRLDDDIDHQYLCIARKPSAAVAENRVLAETT